MRPTEVPHRPAQGPGRARTPAATRPPTTMHIAAAPGTHMRACRGGRHVNKKNGPCQPPALGTHVGIKDAALWAPDTRTHTRCT